MKTVFGNKEVIKKLGYELIGHFTIPDSVWWDKFYKFLTPKIKSFRKFYKDDAEAQKILDHEEGEIELFRKYSEYYGYVFYVMKKI